MLRFMGGRFHMPGASVTIPEGFYMDTDPELADDFGIFIIPKDQAFSVHLSYCEHGRTDEALRKILGQYDEYSMIRDISPTAHNGLCGHDAIYTSGSEGYYEVRFQVPDQYHLMCLITAKANTLEDGGPGFPNGHGWNPARGLIRLLFMMER